jgi:hypothetical protein
MENKTRLKKIVIISLLIELFFFVLTFLIKINHFNCPYISIVNLVALIGLGVVFVIVVFWLFVTLI